MTGYAQEQNEAAYIVMSSGGLALVTAEGRWLIQSNECALEPGTMVQDMGQAIVLRDATVCQLDQRIFVDPTPCANVDGTCSLDMEPRG